MMRVPSWAVGMAARHSLQQHEVLWHFTASSGWREELPAYDYVILNLRKCTKGLPLLPRTASFSEAPPADPSAEWEPMKMADWALAKYLKAFLERIGADGGQEVFDSLDGRPLVPYQAAVRRGAWAGVWKTLSAAFRTQRAAYRRLLGGRCAPEIIEGAEARLLPLDAPQGALRLPHPYPAPEASDAIPIRCTFVHFHAAKHQEECPTALSLEDVYAPSASTMVR